MIQPLTPSLVGWELRRYTFNTGINPANEVFDDGRILFPLFTKRSLLAFMLIFLFVLVGIQHADAHHLRGKSQKVELKSKMLVIGSSSHDIGIDENPDEVDYQPLIDFEKFRVEDSYDWGMQDMSVTKHISLKSRLTEI